MIAEYCDRCKANVTGKQIGALHGGDDCDRDGNGTMNDHWDILCLRCYRVIKAFITTPHPPTQPTRHRKPAR